MGDVFRDDDDKLMEQTKAVRTPDVEALWKLAWPGNSLGGSPFAELFECPLSTQSRRRESDAHPARPVRKTIANDRAELQRDLSGVVFKSDAGRQ